ncbi:MAG: nucleotidyltransferase domain-containing protein [Chloroflexi bacterium]|nr:nucleotidyltransferase domain-containing protein [Chloroflexota bacterium]
MFGSFATGDIHEGSDVDICVVADFKEDFLDRIKVLMDLNDLGLPLEPVGYTPAEFGTMQESGNSFIGEVVEKGRVLYEAQAPSKDQSKSSSPQRRES